MSDENNLPTDLEEHKDIPVETQYEEQSEQITLAEAEAPTPGQEKGAKKPSTTTPRAIRLATISRLLEKHRTQMDRVGRMVQPLQTQINSIVKMVQPLQKQLKSVERQTEPLKQLPSQLKQLQKQMSQVQKDSQKIRSLSSKKTTTTSTKRKNVKRIRKR